MHDNITRELLTNIVCDCVTLLRVIDAIETNERDEHDEKLYDACAFMFATLNDITSTFVDNMSTH